MTMGNGPGQGHVDIPKGFPPTHSYFYNEGWISSPLCRIHPSVVSVKVFPKCGEVSNNLYDDAYIYKLFA